MSSSKGNENSLKKSEGLISQKKTLHVQNTCFLLGKKRQLCTFFLYISCIESIESDSPGPVGFAIGLVNSVINLPDKQVKFFEESKLTL